MINHNLVEDLPEYEFADKAIWDDNRLRSVAKGLFDFLKIHVNSETAPEEVLFDADQALENIAFEMKMRKDEAAMSSSSAR